MALRAEGWHVSVTDEDPAVEEQALALGAADATGVDADADITFCAVPVGSLPEVARMALEKTRGVVTDVGSTKADVCGNVADARFVGGHPMAGSEQDGISGASATLFSGATWVLTPSESTSEESFARVRAVVRSLGAEVLTMGPQTHDELVAQVSHVPHLTAAALMNLADDSSVQHRAVLRLAAGGFRDMTRISAGRPTIWPDICIANRDAIVQGLDALIESLGAIRTSVADQKPSDILTMLTRARTARINLPTGFSKGKRLSELHVPIPDRPGEIAAIATLSTELDVNIHDLEITHSGEGRQGVMIMVVDTEVAERLVGGLMARGYRPSLRTLDD